MKILVVQEPIIQTDITPEELTAHWEKLYEIPGVDDVNIYLSDDYPTLEQQHELLADCDACFGLWVNSSFVNEEFLSRHPRLKYIATLGHGFGTFDTGMTRRLGITITNTIYGSHTISEHAFALLMDVCHHLQLHCDYVKGTDWTDPACDKIFCKALTRQIELYGKTVGIIGLGDIGHCFAQMARGFGMHVLAYDNFPKSGPDYDFIHYVTLDELLAQSDIITLHCPHTPQTAGIISREAIAKMKDGMILINTARGALIDEDALADALKSGKVMAAGLDVLREEPPVHGSPLLDCPNALITGHIAWLTRESRLRAVDMAIDNFRSYLDGHPVSVINR